MTAPAPGTLTRQQLYDKIRETSKDEYILAEMKRLGFWNTDEEKPSVSEDIIQRRGELSRELNQLLKQQRLYQNPEEALKAMRKERMKAALDKRAETKRNQADERHQRALQWHEKQQRSINWLGEAVSLGLFADEQGNDVTPAMKQQSLPVFADHLSLAEAMGISINELRFLAYQRRTSKVSHYQQFQIAKKTGGYRAISAPMPRLKRVQYWILENILSHVPLHEAAHGFVAGRSILTNARPHVGCDVVVNLDLQNFFPAISYRRVKGVFRHMGYSEPVATVLGLLCCEPDTQQVELDGERYFVQQGEARLPQGAPTSPALSNILCRSLDGRLQGLAEKHGFNYTRYADDMTFSGNGAAREHVRKLLWGVQAIIKEEGFVLHPDKTRIMHKGRQQEVTGLVVNERLSVDRKTLRRFRALLQQIERDGPVGKSWNGVTEPDRLMRSVLGFANFVAMVLPEKGAVLKQRAKSIYAQHRDKASQATGFKGQVRKADFRKLAAAGQAPLLSLPQAQAKAAPVREKTADEMKAERQNKIAQRRQDNVAASGGQRPESGAAQSAASTNSAEIANVNRHRKQLLFKAVAWLAAAGVVAAMWPGTMYFLIPAALAFLRFVDWLTRKSVD
ncbi:MAG: reverse transcriptase family protein [Thiolinea sp.]